MYKRQDYRSLYLHFENCCPFYGGHMVRDVLEDVRATLAESHEVTMADVLRTPLYKWLAQVLSLIHISQTRTIVRCALIASLDTAVSLVRAPIACGAVQARVSEAFTLRPVLVPDAVVGVTLGCFLTNLVGVLDVYKRQGIIRTK